MRIIIAGGGKVGRAIAEQLTREGHDIVVIDVNRRVIQQISDGLDVMAICGNGSDVEIMREAGAPESDLLIACTAQDELNLISCMFAKKLGCKNTIARVRAPEYAEQIYLLAEDMGLSMVINPEFNCAREIFRLIEIPGVFKRDTFADGRIEIVELLLKEGDTLDGCPLRDLPKKMKLRALVCAVQRDEEAFIPDGSVTLRAGDKVYICAPATSIVRILRHLGSYKKMAKDVMLIGGSRIAEYLTALLTKTDTRVKIIEVNPERTRVLSATVEGAEIICADASNPTVLQSENVEKMDSVVTLTNIDEENLVLSMYLKRLGVPQVITKVDHTGLGGMLTDFGLERVVSPERLCAGAIIRYVRAMQNSEGSSVLTLHHLVDGKVDAMEFAVTEHTRHLGKTFREITFKPNILVACINRNGKILIPNGNDCLQNGDTVVVVTTSSRVIVDLNDVFAQ